MPEEKTQLNMSRIFYVAKLLLFVLLVCYVSSACTPMESAANASDTLPDGSQENISFQEYLWQQHSLDLMIQIGLLLAGAFGVAGLLPAPNEE